MRFGQPRPLGSTGAASASTCDVASGWGCPQPHPNPAPAGWVAEGGCHYANLTSQQAVLAAATSPTDAGAYYCCCAPPQATSWRAPGAKCDGHAVVDEARQAQPCRAWATQVGAAARLGGQPGRLGQDRNNAGS